MHDPKKPANKQTPPPEPQVAKVIAPPVPPTVVVKPAVKSTATPAPAPVAVQLNKPVNGMVAPTVSAAPLVSTEPVEVSVPVDMDAVKLDSRDFHSPLPENLMTNDSPDVPPTHIDPQPPIVMAKSVSLNFACTLCGARYPHQVMPCPLCGGPVVSA